MVKSCMNDSRQSTVTRLLAEVREGDRSAFDKLVPLVYQELRELAHAQRRNWYGDETLDTTALTHEAYLRLAAQARPDWESHAHFKSVAARAMRQILIDYAKSKRREKRGGGMIRVPLEELRIARSGEGFSSRHAEALIALDRSLRKLTDRNDRQGRIVECRFFGGMTVPDTAAALGISPATVKRGWAMSKAWLYRDLEGVLEE
jgi:RNA polymerase sigma factor (TIGR02999 family)